MQEPILLRTVVFYNAENLFDTKNDSLVHDDERTPDGKYKWTAERVRQKEANLARVIHALEGTVGADIVGLCEIENRGVLESLIRHPLIASADFRIIHFDSPDERGMDVALLYKTGRFIPTSAQSRRLLIFDKEGIRDYTRDQLVVGGMLDKEQIYLIVNHWPSRSGGQARSAPHRKAAALLTKKIIDSLSKQADDGSIIVMGDFNDNPTDHSIKNILDAWGEQDSVFGNRLFNPMELPYRNGEGSLAYRDSWSLFDQFLLSPGLCQKRIKKFSYLRAGVFRPLFLLTTSGKYRGYPFRTFASGVYQGGYSDHFPVYLQLIRNKD